jgi:hypothetical protein
MVIGKCFFELSNFYNKMDSNTIKIRIKKYATITVAVIDDFIRRLKMYLLLYYNNIIRVN